MKYWGKRYASEAGGEASRWTNWYAEGRKRTLCRLWQAHAKDVLGLRYWHRTDSFSLYNSPGLSPEATLNAEWNIDLFSLPQIKLNSIYILCIFHRNWSFMRTWCIWNYFTHKMYILPQFWSFFAPKAWHILMHISVKVHFLPIIFYRVIFYI